MTLQQLPGTDGGAAISILFEDAVELREEAPPYFLDTGLDQVEALLFDGLEPFHLGPVFRTALRTTEQVRFRQAAYTDLIAQRPAVDRFAGLMRRMRDSFEVRDSLRHPLQVAAAHLEAAARYLAAVDVLARDIDQAKLQSRALQRLMAGVADYVAQPELARLRTELAAIQEGLGNVIYTLRLNPGSLTVSPDAGLPDLAAEVDETFARFRQEDVPDTLARFHDYLDMNHVETAVLDRVATLNPELFTRLQALHQQLAFPADLIASFDREAAFYTRFADTAATLEPAGLVLTIPRLSAEPMMHAKACFDLALALQQTGPDKPVVVNDAQLDPPEQFLVVTGPNQGGKTTYARMIATLHHLAALGLPVPGSDVELRIPDRVLTLFERDEDAHSGHGRLESELLRTRDALDLATGRTLVVVNEIFASTSFEDSLDISARVLDAFIARGCMGVWVTFIDELTRLSPATVSMVSDTDPADPTARTFTVSRRTADGLAYALSIARRHDLTYEQLTDRLG